MLVVFSPIFVADAKIIFRYNFVAPLMTTILTGQQFHMLPCQAMYSTYMRSFQYKIWKNILFLIKNLLFLGPNYMCSFCNLHNETLSHIFYEYERMKGLWWDFVQYFRNSLILPTLTLCYHFGIFDSASNDSISKTIKSFSITFCLYLNYPIINLEKATHKYK